MPGHGVQSRFPTRSSTLTGMDPLTPTGTDPLTELLNGVRTSGAVFNQSFFSGSWALCFEDGSPMALAVPLRGSPWVIP
jgi:hypothetical protein